MTTGKNPPLLWLAAGSAGGLLLVSYWIAGWSEEGVRIVVRWTAKLGLPLFVAAFTARPLRSLRRTAWTAWLLRNRRALGLSFALFHGVHLLALVALAYAFPLPFVEELSGLTLWGGGFAYALLFAMVATSNDSSIRALGRLRWRRLHTLGGWFLWLIFAQSYLPLAAGALSYVPLGLLVLGVPSLRGLAWVRGHQ
jgi:DMSO/TMAO reductase YedYZ heme-binding membrane subunit